jgi:disulfide bond formation protein DsbB
MKNNWNTLFFAWIISLISLLGSLFFSDVMGYPPCVLCWYQRIAMYPLVFIYPFGLFPFEEKVVKSSVLLVLIGWSISFYHNLLYYKILPESHSPCVKGISCTSVQLEWLGFITIPFLSFTAFSMIGFCLFKILRTKKND